MNATAVTAQTIGTGTEAGPPAEARAPARRPPPMVMTVDRVLIGARGDLSEARIRVTDGAGGATEIRLATGRDGHAVGWQLLTATTGSRETLSDVMREVHLRLRRRGIVLSADDPGSSPRQSAPGKEDAR